ncbi:MAG: ATP synthase F0 subunit B [Candidatus Doudnabacteria bacterium RIFCSPLOWO2_01_FULL_44_21]|uniref:ATP synthase subunit b n=1 Tax=Candidatus Doudnabacteria bacterium RIFCSPLOWO2_01_FULL_44_21 TaxID=1817841 RepID=A0A1F5PWR6_9BACT|nr:MAG: ATP synthase F0 subunit B [Candidatus Doudnabacteria bacterium RIFCSPHIGHO2_02_FULL_43_13b]OGE94383.1 MAG: ATP synthase F0 subunit B [Candidatus Doudnabacteria bacterium RIFCSPLOWO2_01_FULL_44_21]
MESNSVLGTLGIDWKLFLAQLVNFGIVLFIFWRWVAKPLGATLTKRQERIEQGLKNADQMDTDKKKFEEWKIQEMKKIRSEADNILRQTNDTANKIKQETIVDANTQAVRIIAQAKDAINVEKIQMLKEAKQEVATLVIAASENILRSKLDSKHDHELISVSIKHVK